MPHSYPFIQALLDMLFPRTCFLSNIQTPPEPQPPLAILASRAAYCVESRTHYARSWLFNKATSSPIQTYIYVFIPSIMHQSSILQCNVTSASLFIKIPAWHLMETLHWEEMPCLFMTNFLLMKWCVKTNISEQNQTKRPKDKMTMNNTITILLVMHFSIHLFAVLHRGSYCTQNVYG